MERFACIIGEALQSTARSLNKTGASLKGLTAPTVPDALACKHRRLVGLEGKIPSIGQSAWIAPSASVIGKVEVGAKSTVWYGAVLRGDVNSIRIGSLSSVGDRCVIHVSSGHPVGAKGTSIGDKVIVEPGSILHACTVEDGGKIESGAIVYDGAVVGRNSIVAAGSFVPQNKTIPEGELWAGSPAKFVRKVTQEEIDQQSKVAEKYHQIAEKHAVELAKPEEQKRKEMEDYSDKFVSLHQIPEIKHM